MVPNNIEKQFREQLNQRQIAPSSNSWDRLDAMLTVAETKTEKPSYVKWYAAAALLLFFSIGAFFYLQNDSKSQMLPSTVVHQETSSPSSINDTTAVVKTIHQEAPIQKQSNATIAIHTPKSFNPINHQKQIKSPIPTNSQPDLAVNVSKQTPHTDEAMVNHNVINETVSKNTYPVVVNSPKKVKVDPSSLLSEVEGELNQAYRESKLDIIKRNYKAIRVALATRNEQQ